MKPRRDEMTLDLFEVPVARTPLPGALNFNRVLCHLIADILKSSTRSRFEIAARMVELTGDPVITKNSLDAWTAESREGWRFPLEFLPAFEVACETTALSAWIAGIRGGKMLMGKDTLDAEIGKLERLKEEAARKIKQLKHAIGEME